MRDYVVAFATRTQPPDCVLLRLDTAEAHPAGEAAEATQVLSLPAVVDRGEAPGRQTSFCSDEDVSAWLSSESRSRLRAQARHRRPRTGLSASGPGAPGRGSLAAKPARPARLPLARDRRGRPPAATRSPSNGRLWTQTRSQKQTPASAGQTRTWTQRILCQRNRPAAQAHRSPQRGPRGQEAGTDEATGGGPLSSAPSCATGTVA